MRERERERKAQDRLRALRERRKHPAHPDAQINIAAVAMESALLEALEVRLRPDPSDPSGDGYRSSHGLEVPELGVLLTVLHLLRGSNPIVIAGMSTSARWPRREPPLVPLEGLKRALLELRREGWLGFRVEGDQAAVTYGPRTEEVARKWGIVLAELDVVAF